MPRFIGAFFRVVWGAPYRSASSVGVIHVYSQTDTDGNCDANSARIGSAPYPISLKYDSVSNFPGVVPQGDRARGHSDIPVHPVLLRLDWQRVNVR